MIIPVIGYLGAAGIMAFASLSWWRLVHAGHASNADALSFAVLTMASGALAIYAAALRDPVFLAANATSAFFDGLITWAAWRAHRPGMPDE